MNNFRGGKYQGEFWLADQPSFKTRGELAIDKDGDVRLSVKGGGELAAFLASPDPRTVLGSIAADYPYRVTMFDAFTESTSTRRVGPGGEQSVTGKVACNGVLIGHHIAGLDDPQFNEARVSMSCLSEWSRLFGISGKMAAEGTSRAIKQQNRVSSPVSLNDGARVSFVTAYEGPLFFNNVKTVTFSEVDYVRIELPNRETINQIWRRAHAIRSFIGFAMRRAAYVQDMEFVLPGNARAVLIFAQSRSSDAVSTISPLFTRPAISGRMSHYLCKWHDKFQKLEAVLMLASSADYQLDTYYSFRFLSYVQALETFHRRMRKGRFEDHDSYKPTLAALQAAVPKHLKKDYRDRIEAGLAHLNEWSLLRRLYDLYDLEERSIAGLFPERDRDMRLIRDVRNYLTHFEDQKGRWEKYIQERAFVVLTRKLRLFVEICLLRAMGTTDVAKSRLLERVRDYQWLQRESHQRT